MPKQYQKTEVKSGRIGGLFYRVEDSDKPMLVIFNQWRSNAHSLLSKFIAEQVFEKKAYSTVLFIDRIASGGASDEKLTKEERANMRRDGEFQFGKTYAEAIEKIRKKHDLPKQYVIGGSSAGAPAVLAAAEGMSKAESKHIIALVLVEPGAMRRHGFGNGKRGALPQAFMRHLVAYRHRVGRGWWTPMDKEQYFGKKGTMFEYRAIWFAGDSVLRALCEFVRDPAFPPIRLVLSRTSHVHAASDRQTLRECAVEPHEVKEITGNHDKICQPPSLSKIYAEATTRSW